jgi:hypothetical protein
VKSFNHLIANKRGGIQPFNQIVWYGDDDLGCKVPAGVYFIYLESYNTNKLTRQKIIKLE